MDLMTRADMERGMKEAAQAASSAVQSATESMVRGLANGVSYIALEEWTMQVSSCYSRSWTLQAAALSARLRGGGTASEHAFLRAGSG